MDGLTPGEVFLRLLDPDPVKAEERYRSLRAKLAFFFAHNGCRDPENWTDEVVFRVVRALQKDAGVTGDIVGYCYGFAKKLRYEYGRAQVRDGAAAPETDDATATRHNPSPHRLSPVESSLLLEECLGALRPADSRVFTEYFTADRVALARALGISAASLRLRVFRIRAKLRECLEGKPPEEPHGG